MNMEILNSKGRASERCVLYLASAKSIHTVRWVNAIAQAGIKVHLASLDAPTEPIDPRVSLHFARHGRGMRFGYFANVLWCRKLIAQLKPALLHAHYASGYGTLAGLCGFHPTILSVWGSDVYEFPYQSPLHRRLLQFNLRHADRILSTSHAMAMQTSKFTAKEITVTPFGVDLEKFKPLPLPPFFSEGDIVVGTVKTLAEKYGIEYLIRAFSLLKKKLPATPLKLLIVGDGPQRAMLEDLARSCGLSQDTCFTGPVPHAEVPRYLNAIDVVVVPSDSESFGVAAIEASACCKPVVVSDVGGLPEVVEDGVTGLVVKSRDAEAIADAVAMLVARPDLQRKLGEAGRDRVVRHYEWNANVAGMLSVYDNILGMATAEFAHLRS